jgi:hypothetical protein
MSPAFSLTRYAIWIRRKAKRDYWSPPQSSAFLGSGYPGNFRRGPNNIHQRRYVDGRRH